MGCDQNTDRFYYCAQLKTPQSRHRLNFNGVKGHTTPNPNSAPSKHPIEVIARIHDYPEWKDKPLSVLQINSNSQSIWVRADFGHRDFTLDGVSVSEEEDLDDFYRTGLKAMLPR
ncbi:hypothetical protein QN277_020292 [Acacia crassicarpa]|uniref:Uncharacterized protein n=1 Tax=Acacia crassicarpa TaxID=499986 RepID=A0AAE1MN49_9FABA|nr:hypothetical protein QN277_020292 [Acacia crassicarpa]